MVHSRIVEIDGRKSILEFGHEGVLYKSSFIMYDKQTDSKWNHSTGLAMMGPLAGTRLDLQPSRVVRWKTWKEAHPDTRVLAREGRWGFMGTYIADKQPAELGLSVGQGPHAKLFPFDVLLKHEVVNDVITPHEVVVTINPSTKEALAFSRKVGKQTLTFRPHRSEDNGRPLMRDQETGTLWNTSTGRAIKGSLQGTELTPLISVPWLKERWRQIYRGGTVYSGS